MTKYIWDGTGWVDPGHFYARNPNPQRSDLPCPHLIRDTMDATWNPADGLYYDSKSAYYRSVKAKGGEIDDRPYEDASKDHRVSEPEGVAEDLKRTMDHLGV